MSDSAERAEKYFDLPSYRNHPLDNEVRPVTINLIGRLPAICQGIAYCLKRDLNVDAQYIDADSMLDVSDADVIIVLDRLNATPSVGAHSFVNGNSRYVALYEETYLSPDFLKAHGFDCGLPISRPLHELVRVVKNVLVGRGLFWDGTRLREEDIEVSEPDQQDTVLVDLLTKGFTHAEICDELNISRFVLKNRLASLKKRFGARTILEACINFRHLASLGKRKTRVALLSPHFDE
jgi:hypothetical protein